ncbi:MAG TPA: hypothetical protein VN970_04280, partial [Thermoanaerobaculia bacterium]|nr:hypothetical protein [Thermoanaerobaculia bacterium]
PRQPRVPDPEALARGTADRPGETRVTSSTRSCGAALPPAGGAESALDPGAELTPARGAESVPARGALLAVAHAAGGQASAATSSAPLSTGASREATEDRAAAAGRPAAGPSRDDTDGTSRIPGSRAPAAEERRGRSMSKTILRRGRPGGHAACCGPKA